MAEKSNLSGKVIKADEDVINNIDINISQVPLFSNLKKEYSGYKYTITNKSSQKLNLVNAQIINGVNGSVAFNNINFGHPIGITWAVCGPAGLFSFGIAWLVGIVATPIVWVISDSSKNHTRKESIPYSSMVNLGTIVSGGMLTVNTLVPIGTTPQLKLDFQDNQTKEIYEIAR